MMAEVQQTRYTCDHQGCDAEEVCNESLASLPSGWVSVYITQGTDPNWESIINKTYCGKEHAVPHIIAATQRIEEAP